MTQSVSFKKQSLYYAVGMVFYLACQWLTTVLVTRMDLVQGGILTLAIAMTNPFSAIALFSMRAYQVSDIDGKFSNGIYIASRLISMLFSGFLCFVYALHNRHDPFTIGCILLYMGLRLCEAWVDVYQGIEHKAGRLDIVGRSFLLRGFLSTGGFFLVFAITRNLLWGLIAMVVLSLVSISFYDVIQCHRLGPIRPQFDKKLLLKLFVACLPLTLNSFLISHTSALPSLALEAHASAAIVGIYGALNAPCIIVQTAGSFIFNPLIPQFALKIKNRQKQALLKQFFVSVAVITAISLICGLGSWILGPWGLNLLFGSEVADYAGLLPSMVLVSGFITLTWFFALLLIIQRCYHGLLITNVLSTAVTWIACDMLIPQGGIAYAPGALAIGILVRAVLYVFFLWRGYVKLFC